MIFCYDIVPDKVDLIPIISRRLEEELTFSFWFRMKGEEAHSEQGVLYMECYR